MSVLSSIIDRSISGSFSSSVFYIRDYTFYKCTGLTSVSFPKVIRIGVGAFQDCSGLTSASFPIATSIYSTAFSSCSKLTSVSLPSATYIESSAFRDCSSLTTIYVGTNTSTVCTLDTNVFMNCSNLSNIYVPSSLVSSYQNATNWSEHASKIKAAP